MSTLVQINATCNWGSTGRIAEQVGLLARSKGWDCYLAHGARYIQPSSLNDIRMGGKSDNLFHAFISKFFGAHGLGSRLATKRLIRQLQEIQPDIIHLHNIHGYYINYPILFEYLSKSGIPVVWTLHDCWSMTGHCTHFEKIGCGRWKSGCCGCPQKRAQYGTLLFNMSKRNYELKKKCFNSVNNLTIVPVSQWLSDIVAESYLKDKSIKVINNGIDLNVFKPVGSDLRKRLNIGFDTPVLIGVASDWDDEKGLKELIQLSREGKYQVIVIGVTSRQSEGLPHSIMAIERTRNQSELVEYYSMADVLVNPTYNDTFPTVNIEALACGTPVVTYQTGGSPEIIDKNTGIAVPRGDYAELKAAINTVISNGKGHYSKACRERAVKYFNKDERFEDYMKLYGELISEKKDKSGI